LTRSVRTEAPFLKRAISSQSLVRPTGRRLSNASCTSSISTNAGFMPGPSSSLTPTLSSSGTDDHNSEVGFGAPLSLRRDVRSTRESHRSTSSPTTTSASSSQKLLDEIHMRNKSTVGESNSHRADTKSDGTEAARRRVASTPLLSSGQTTADRLRDILGSR
jgi:hypothetical protein